MGGCGGGEQRRGKKRGGCLARRQPNTGRGPRARRTALTDRPANPARWKGGRHARRSGGSGRGTAGAACRGGRNTDAGDYGAAQTVEGKKMRGVFASGPPPRPASGGGLIRTAPPLPTTPTHKRPPLGRVRLDHQVVADCGGWRWRGVFFGGVRLHLGRKRLAPAAPPPSTSAIPGPGRGVAPIPPPRPAQRTLVYRPAHGEGGGLVVAHGGRGGAGRFFFREHVRVGACSVLQNRRMRDSAGPPPFFFLRRHTVKAAPDAHRPFRRQCDRSRGCDVIAPWREGEAAGWHVILPMTSPPPSPRRLAAKRSEFPRTRSPPASAVYQRWLVRSRRDGATAAADRDSLCVACLAGQGLLATEWTRPCREPCPRLGAGGGGGH